MVSIHVLAGRTKALDAFRCMDTNAHKQSQPLQQKAASSQKVAHVALLRGLCRDMLWLWPIETDNARHKKDFLSSEEKEQS